MTKNNKKQFGGIIKDWQVHTLTVTKKAIDKVYPGEDLQPMIISGTVVKDELGRWYPGYHMRTSLVKKLDRKKGEVETRNTIYKLEGKEGADVLPNMGNDILKVTYD